MKDELRDLVSDIKEQVIYLHEIGVEAMDVNLSGAPIDVPVIRNTRPEPVQVPAPAEMPKIQVDVPPPPENECPFAIIVASFADKTCSRLEFRSA